jgi:lysyl-tRNA synthetase class 2
MRDIISDEIFEAQPEFLRAVVIARKLRIGNRVNPRLATLISDAQEVCRTAGGEYARRIDVWDAAHAKFGSNPKKFPPSIRALSDRVRKGKDLPYINDAVAIMNAVSLRFGVPVGGDDLGTITGDLRLDFSTGNERFVPLGGGEGENPTPGEPIYFDTGSGAVLCRRWNWRNGDQTKVTEQTSSLLMNVDGLGMDLRPLLEEAAETVARLLREECGAETQCDMLWSGRRAIIL